MLERRFWKEGVGCYDGERRRIGLLLKSDAGNGKQKKYEAKNISAKNWRMLKK